MKKVKIIILIFILPVISYAQDLLPSTQMLFPTFKKVNYISSPFVSFDSTHFIFMVQIKDNFTFFECINRDTSWSEPVELKGINENTSAKKYKNSPVYNYDCSKIYFEALNGTNTDIFVSSRTDTGWTNPELLPKTINSDLNEGDPSISPDDNSIYFIRFTDPKNKETGTIYRSVKNENGQWDSAVALIQPVTLGLERTPRILADNKTIIFSSNRDNNNTLGLYYTKNIFGDSWFLPQSLGIFSKDADMYPSVDFKGKTLYFSSIKSKNTASVFSTLLRSQFKPDITNLVTGKITDTAGNPVNATIIVRDPVSLYKYATYHNNPQTGQYEFFVPLNSKYILDFNSPGYSHFYYNYTNNHNSFAIDTINAKIFNNVSITIKAFDKEIYEPLDIDIAVTDSIGDTLKPEIKKINKGWISFSLPIGQNYSFKLTNQYTEPYSFNLDLSGTIIYPKLEKNAEITSIKTPIYLNIANATTNQPVECEIVITNTSTSQKITYQTSTDKDGNIVIYGRKGDTYNVAISPKGYAFYSTDITIGDQPKEEITAKIQPLTQDATIELNNITFETNSAELKDASYSELDKVINLLSINTNIKVEISAHTDDKGTDSYNLLLSQRRAKSVVDYLLQHNIPSDRMIAKGYGETKPIIPNTTDENRAKNRRVEIKILKVDNI